jgi:SAM-dependent methyltransferase
VAHALRVAAPVDAFLAALGLPEPARDEDELVDVLVARRGEAQADRVLRAVGRAGDRDRYRGLLADPATAVDFTWLYAGPVTRLVLEDLDARLAALPAGARVLDLGSGEGLVPVFAAWRRPDLDVLATDLRPEAGAVVAWLRRRLGLRGPGFHRVALGRGPRALRTRDHDLVMAHRVLHELPAPRVGALLAGAVAPGGAALVTERLLDLGGLQERARAAARAGLGLDPAQLRLLPARELDAEGVFPAYVLRPGAPAPAPAALAAAWSAAAR